MQQDVKEKVQCAELWLWLGTTQAEADQAIPAQSCWLFS